jgi:hypothetical protein
MRKFERPATAAGYSEYPDPAYADTGVRVRNRAGETDRLNRAYSIYNAYNLIG